MLNRSCRGVNPFAQLYKLRMKNFTIKAKKETAREREEERQGKPSRGVIAAAIRECEWEWEWEGEQTPASRGKLVSLVLSLVLPLSLSSNCRLV